MDKRFVLALVLTSLVVIATPLIFPPQRPATSTITGRDSTNRDPAPASTDTTRTAPIAQPSAPVLSQPAPAGGQPAISAAEIVQNAAVDTTEIVGKNADFRFVNAGARLVSADLHHFRSYRPGRAEITLRGEFDPLVRYQLLDPAGDTINLDNVLFQRSESPAAGNAKGSMLTYRGATRIGTLVIEYLVTPDNYMAMVTGRIEQQTTPATLLIWLPGGIRSEEADAADDRSHLAFAVKARRESAERIRFGDLDAGERDTIRGPITWAASKNKYFLTALLAPSDSQALGGVVITGSPRTGKVANRAEIAVARAVLPGKSFAFEIYAGPQEWKRLNALGRDFENVNPYGGFMQGIIQPFATIVMRVLLWMREKFDISYGWVLVLFGLMVRVVTWPLNQSAMKTSLRMQRIQPQLTAVQQKYKSNPEKQREEIMAVYREHGMTPFSPLMGCLPMLLPMPVLFALFFVFQNTIEFRGVPFLWLPDISLHDPLYIIPVVMGLSMYALSWIGMRNAPPNPQAKMMSYALPVMMTFLFWKFASGLNLYYTVQNIAALPQQWLIARDRGKAAPVQTTPVVVRR